MLLDAFAEFADATSVAGSAGTALVGNQIDLGIGREVGNGQPVYLIITVDTAIQAAGAGTIQFALASDTTAAVSTTAKQVLTTPAYTTANNTTALPAGAVLFAGAIPATAFTSTNRYLGLLVTIATQTVSAGKINAFLTLDPNAYKLYADAQN